MMEVRGVLFAFCVVLAGVSSQGNDYSQLCSVHWNTVGKAVIDLDHVADFNVLRSISAYFCDNYPINVQVWQPVGNLDFELVWEYPMMPPNTTPGEQQLVLPLDLHFPVQGTYRIGFSSIEFGDFPIGMTFFPANQGSVVVSEINALPEPFRQGEIYSFVELTFPYKFSAALCNDTSTCTLPDISLPTRPLLNETDGGTGIPTFNVTIGLPGPPGPMGIPGPTGPNGLPGIMGFVGIPGPDGFQGITGDTGPEGQKGPRGDRGDAGLIGIVGEIGPAGPPGPPGPVLGTVAPTAAASGTGCECTGFSDPNLVLGMICWALVITLFILIMLIVATKNPHLTS